MDFWVPALECLTQWVWEGPRMCISRKFPGDPGTLLGEPSVWYVRPMLNHIDFVKK